MKQKRLAKSKTKTKASGTAETWDKRAWLLERSDHRDTAVATFASPVCDVVVGACDLGVHSVSWKTADGLPEETPSPSRQPWGQVSGREGSSPHLDAALTWLARYFEDPHAPLPTPTLCFRQTKSRSCVPIWEMLRKQVGPGSTITYGGLAKLCGNPRASRHMGYAMGHNPVGLVVPCHRVVTSSGKPGNYCRGRRNWLKAWLLEHERQETRGVKVL